MIRWIVAGYCAATVVVLLANHGAHRKRWWEKTLEEIQALEEIEPVRAPHEDGPDPDPDATP